MRSLRRSVAKWIAIVSLASVVAVSLSGCNTFSGAGRDIQYTGEAMQDAVQ